MKLGKGNTQMHVPDHNIELEFIRGNPSKRRVSGRFLVIWRGAGWEFQLPYEFDGSSIPRLLWFWLGGPFDYGNAQSGALHDAAYDGRILRNGFPYWMTPVEAHSLWRELRTYLLSENATRWNRCRYWVQGWLCWAALVGYWFSWGRKAYMSKNRWEVLHHG